MTLLGGKVRHGEDCELQHLLTDQNQLHFEVLAFKLCELEGHLVVKMWHYTPTNKPVRKIVGKVPERAGLFLAVKELQPQLGEPFKSTQYQVFLVDRGSKALVRHAIPREEVQRVLFEMNQKGLDLRLQAFSQEDTDFVASQPEAARCWAFAQLYDQYHRPLDHPFIMPFSRAEHVEIIKLQLVERAKRNRPQYNYRKSNDPEDLVDIEDAHFEECDLVYVEFNRTRRQVNYWSHSLKELPKDEETLDIGKDKTGINLGLVLTVAYEEDATLQKGALKIYNQQEAPDSQADREPR